MSFAFSTIIFLSFFFFFTCCLIVGTARSIISCLTIIYNFLQIWWCNKIWGLYQTSAQKLYYRTFLNEETKLMEFPCPLCGLKLSEKCFTVAYNLLNVSGFYRVIEKPFCHLLALGWWDFKPFDPEPMFHSQD